MTTQKVEKTEKIMVVASGTGERIQKVVLSDTCATAIVVEKNVHARIVLKGEGHLRMEVRENAEIHVMHVVSQDDEIRDLRREVRVGRGSKLTWTDVCFGDRELDVRTFITLSEEGANTVHNCVYIGGAAHRKVFRTTIRHAASHTTSRMHVRGVLGGSARAAYKGITIVDSNAHGSDADQRHRTLLLTDTAEVTSDPVLEIHTEDVTCGHGASISRMDEEKIFFLKARGITEKKANEMIVYGFIHELIEDMDDENATALHEYTERLVCTS